MGNELHLRKADVFNLQLKEATKSPLARVIDNDTAVIAMDFQKNLPLPLTGVSQEFYKRQLWLYNFCFHNCIHKNATMYLYAEHYPGKGPNEVISCLDHYLSTLPATTKNFKILKFKFFIHFRDIADCPVIATLLVLKNEEEEKIEL